MFIVLEGIEGSGKTTLAKNLKDKLTSLGFDVVVTREPGGVPSAESIRNNIMDYDVDKKAELMLFLAARREHLVKKVLPLLEEGKIIICDRFMYSSLAYQGYGRGLDIEEIRNLHKFVLGDFKADMTFYIDISTETSMKRKNNEEVEINRMDKEEIGFYERVRNGYRELISHDDLAYEINGERSINEVTEDIIGKIVKKKEEK